MAKRGITYIKGEEPNFLKKFKQQVTFAGERCRPVYPKSGFRLPS